MALDVPAKAKAAQAEHKALVKELKAVKRNKWAKLRKELNAYKDTQESALDRSLQTQLKELNAKQLYFDQQRNQLCGTEQRLAQQQAAFAQHQAHWEQNLATRTQELNAATSLQQQLSNNFQALDQRARELEASLGSRKIALEDREADYNRVLGAEHLVHQRDHELDKRERQLAKCKRQAAQHCSPPGAESRAEPIKVDMVPDFEIVEVRRGPCAKANIPCVKVEEDLNFKIVESQTAHQHLRSSRQSRTGRQDGGQGEAGIQAAAVGRLSLCREAPPGLSGGEGARV
ncbi:hypothetical protein CBOM_03468 [Ceraceosorus bombacis]|uniref:Uncharacterized protein n=1 Tax=Ceraceosorus bombacis TaxID=401625 RepID=A0A0P1BNU8_9BASI|nr:hypothetical protein CBOM_03468 [Ceraceosorus bombacis]